MAERIKNLQRGDELIWDGGTGTLHKIETKAYVFEDGDTVLRGDASEAKPALIIHVASGYEVHSPDEVSKAAT